MAVRASPLSFFPVLLSCFSFVFSFFFVFLFSSVAVLPYQSANIFLCPLAFIRCSTHHFFRYFPTCLNRRLPSTAGHVRGKKKQKQKRKNRVVQPFNRAARAACLSEIGSRVGNFRRI